MVKTFKNRLAGQETGTDDAGPQIPVESPAQGEGFVQSRAKIGKVVDVFEAHDVILMQKDKKIFDSSFSLLLAVSLRRLCIHASLQKRQHAANHHKNTQRTRPLSTRIKISSEGCTSVNHGKPCQASDLPASDKINGTPWPSMATGWEARGFTEKGKA